MYTDNWADATDVVVTPPNPEHLVAGAMLAAALSTPCEILGSRPAPLLVASPILETAYIIRRRRMMTDVRPRLWLIAFDEQVRCELGTELLDEGECQLIGPEDVESDPVGRVVRLLEQGLGRYLDERWRTLSRSARRRCMAVRRLLHPPLDPPGTLQARRDHGQAVALAAALTGPQCKTVSEAWNVGGVAWELVRRALCIAEDRWQSPFVHAIAGIDAKPEEILWSLQVVGFSATTQRLRARAREAVNAVREGKTLLVVPHDEAEACRLVSVIMAVAGGSDGGDDLAGAALPVWQPGGAASGGAFQVAIRDEAEAYAAAAADPQFLVLDVPPLEERSMDIPHIALAELWRQHRRAGRPGAPRAGNDTPERLAWMSDCLWPAGTAGLRTWLCEGLRRDPAGDWLFGDASLPRHPGLEAPYIFGPRLTLDTVIAQVVRWAFGSHSQQQIALRRLGVGTSRLPAATSARNGQPRRLLYRDGGWWDRWAVSIKPRLR
jgi:hypothetical protein